MAIINGKRSKARKRVIPSKWNVNGNVGGVIARRVAM
jgi:hypothetical protein